MNVSKLLSSYKIPSLSTSRLSMQFHCVDACGNLNLPRSFLRFRPHLPLPPSPLLPGARVSAALSVSCGSADGRQRPRRGRAEVVKAKKKENVWSVDNELAARAAAEDKAAALRRRKKKARRVRSAGERDPRVLVSGAMLMEIETVLQTQEPVIKPAWDTFASSVSGIWKGVGAVFSPFTAEIEPIGVGVQNENLYDAYTLSCIEKVPPEGPCSQIIRKSNWVALNPLGETRQHVRGAERDHERDRHPVPATYDFPIYESFNFDKCELFEEDVMGMEPGLVFFEDGSYSRGPVEIPVGDYDQSKYYLSPTFKFEQCLVKGCHKRLRIMHTIEFSEGGSDIQIIRVAVYEEQWVSPVNINDGNDVQFDLKPVSQRKRTQPSELTGSWKVFEVSATPIYDEDSAADESGLPYVYLCTETMKKRSLPESSVYFGEEEMLDMQDVTVLWLPGGVTGYVDVNKEGILCIGVGWYSDEGINLVMERDYGMDGKLKEVRWKSEVKRRWTNPHDA
ncbi:uncharacterized protein [Elaeis guineensis]|uniref:LOW QUALITY PROTEIN: uncharacterized protein LOC105053935 n=1 Tax=Elaeis guineensis var. tenera TaxID=51953 RepID=A0A6I9RW60_ELAGV|nr:LOW QUALITY PROTEIN: uncharacterized protein LOC105053935 [Elaeis guineensis]